MTTADVIAGRAKRLERIAEALSWKGGTQEEKLKHVVWTDGNYRVSLGKPGKEAAPDYNSCKYADGHSGNNPNDMLPLLEKDSKRVTEENASFTDVFRELMRFSKENVRSGELFGALLIRSAYMADHSKDEKGNWKYIPSEEAVLEIEKGIPLLYGVSPRAFLHFLDALAWNEDVKYKTLGFDITKGYGRQNNLLTYANIAAAAIGKADIISVFGNFTRPPSGISAISRKNAFEAFPELGVYEDLPRGKKKPVLVS